MLVAQRPREMRYRMCLASCLVAAGESVRGIDVLREALQQDSDHAEARVMLARALLDAGDRDGSMRETDAAMRAARSQPALQPSLADLLVRQGRGKEAASFYRKQVDADRSAIQPRLGLARALLTELPRDAAARAAQLELAAQAALDAMERSKAVPDGHMLLGAALAWYGDPGQAARSLDLGLTFDPRHVGALRLRAVLAAHAGAWNDAQAFMQRAADAQALQESAEPAPLPFEWHALAAHLGVDQALLR
jgi:tetratricopeptide (TPR) repeat protein